MEISSIGGTRECPTWAVKTKFDKVAMFNTDILKYEVHYAIL